MVSRSRSLSQRQERIHRFLVQEGYASVRHLAERTGVSEMTVRRDLESLVELGLVRRMFGGARAEGRTPTERVYGDRLRQHREAKERIADRAAVHVGDGDTVALDGSTTSVYLARKLKKLHVAVLTNSVLIAEELVGSDIEVVMPGGTLRSHTRSLVGPLAERSLRGLHVDVTFFSTGGLHATEGLTDTHDLEASAKRVLLDIAERRVALVDSSKFGQKALHALVPFGAIDLLVTDDRPPEGIGDALVRSGVAVDVADA